MSKLHKRKSHRKCTKFISQFPIVSVLSKSKIWRLMKKFQTKFLVIAVVTVNNIFLSRNIM